MLKCACRAAARYPGFLGLARRTPGCATHSGRAAQPLRAQWEAARQPCPAEVADSAALTTQPLRAKGGTPQGVVKHAGATAEQLRIRSLCVTFLCVQVSAEPHMHMHAAAPRGGGCSPVW